MWLLYFIQNIVMENRGLELDDANLNNLTFIMIFPRTILYLINIVLTLWERKIIYTEIKTSPLSIIDESLTEDLYNNIIQQGKNPDDNELKNEYRRLTLAKNRKTLNDKSN